MFHVLEQPQLPVGPLGEELGLEGALQLLDGDLGAQPSVPGRAGTQDSVRLLQRFQRQMR